MSESTQGDEMRGKPDSAPEMSEAASRARVFSHAGMMLDR